jgi:hypothetical protein
VNDNNTGEAWEGCADTPASAEPKEVSASEEQTEDTLLVEEPERRRFSRR